MGPPHCCMGHLAYESVFETINLPRLQSVSKPEELLKSFDQEDAQLSALAQKTELAAGVSISRVGCESCRQVQECI